MKTNCPECGLTFTDGQRTFSTFGSPTVRLEQHLAGHLEESEPNAKGVEFSPPERERKRPAGKVYGSDPYAYDLDAALVLAGERSSGERLPNERAYDKLVPDARRLSEHSSAITGLWEGDRCRICGAKFRSLAEEDDWRSEESGRLPGVESHRLWHQWLEQSGNIEYQPQADALERELFEREPGAPASSRPPHKLARDFAASCGEQSGGYAGTFWLSRNAARGADVPAAPTFKQLEQHNKTFEPPAYRGSEKEEIRKRALARAAHKAAMEEIGRIYGSLSESDADRMIRDLRREGLTVSRIADQVDISESAVKAVLRGV